MKLHQLFLISSAIVPCFTLSSMAQDEVVKPQKEVGELAATIIKKDITFIDIKADAIANLYRQYTGKRVLVSNAAMAKSISFIQQAPITNGEVAKLLVMACKMEELIFVSLDDNVVKLVTSQEVKNQGLPVVEVEELLPEGDKVVTYKMKFKHIDPAEALRAFSSITGALKSHGSISVVEHAGVILITENASLIRSLIKVKNTIDIPQSQTARKMIQVQHADVEQMAAQLKLIIDAQVKDRPSGAAVTRPANAAANQRGAVANTQIVGQVQKVDVVADPRTNSVFVMGRPVDLVFIEGLIKDFDQPIALRNMSKFHISHLSAVDLISVVQNAIERVQPSSLLGGANRSNGQSRSNLQSSGNGDDTPQARDEAPVSVLVGKTLIIADGISNTLIVQGPPQSIDIVTDIVKQMDIPGKQVQITAMFGRYTRDGELSFGVDFARAFTQKSTGTGAAANSNTGFPLVVDPSTLTGPTAFPTPANAIAGLSLSGQIGRHFFGYLRALESKGKFKLVAQPIVFTKNNREVKLSSGQRIPVPTSTLSSNTGNNNAVTSNTNIEFRDVRLELAVLPLVNDKNEVLLKIKFLNDNIVGSLTINGNSIPTIGTEELETTVTVPNNKVVMIGGLINTRTEKNRTGVPLLSSVPVVKNLFSSTTNTKVKEELVIMIQPKVINGLADLNKMNVTNAAQLELIGDINAGLLPALDEIDSDKKIRNVTRPTRQSRKNKWFKKKSPRDRFQGKRR